VTVHKRLPFFEILCHYDKSIVNGTVAVRMVFTHRIADDTRALSERLVVLDAELIHVIQSTALYRL